jgi:hypothetical protein
MCRTDDGTPIPTTRKATRATGVIQPPDNIAVPVAVMTTMSTAGERRIDIATTGLPIPDIHRTHTATIESTALE